MTVRHVLIPPPPPPLFPPHVHRTAMQVCLILAALILPPVSFKEADATEIDKGARIGDCSENGTDGCPLGFYEEKEPLGTFCSCRAGSSAKRIPGITGCSFANCTSILAPGYWLGYEDALNNDTTRILTGICPMYYCHPDQIHLSYQNSTELDELSCGAQNRKGILCGQCKEGYGLSVISLNMSCTLCEGNFRWQVVVVWFAASFIPFNLLLILFIVLRVNITSGLLCSFVFYCQVLPATQPYIQSEFLPAPLAILTEIILFISNTLNLYVFESVIPPLPGTCLSPSMTALDRLIGDYFFVLLYPLFLFGLFVFVQKLYRRGKFCRPIHVLLTKVGKCIEMCHSRKDSGGSMLPGLCSFFVLQYTRLSLLTLLILAPTFLFRSETDVLRSVLWYDANVDYFSLQHLPYAIPILICSTVYLLIPPLLLLTYPALPQLLVRCHLDGKRPFSYILKVLTKGSSILYFDVFQGCYKPQFRFFAGLFFIFRIFFLIPRAFGSNDSDVFAFDIFIAVIFALVTTLCQPYKSKSTDDGTRMKVDASWQNRIDVLIFGNLALITLFKWYFRVQNFTSTALQVAVATLSVILMYLPLVGFTFYFLYSLWRRYGQRVKKLVVRESTQGSNPVVGGDDEVKATEASVLAEPLLNQERRWEIGSDLQLNNSVLYIDV